MITASKVLSMMDEIEQNVYPCEVWWPQLKRLLKQQGVAEQIVAPDTIDRMIKPIVCPGLIEHDYY